MQRSYLTMISEFDEDSTANLAETSAYECRPGHHYNRMFYSPASWGWGGTKLTQDQHNERKKFKFK